MILCSTSPEEFLNRLDDAEEQRKKANSKFGGGPTQEEKEFSLPGKPKEKLGSAAAAMSKEKVCERIFVGGLERQ